MNCYWEFSSCNHIYSMVERWQNTGLGFVYIRCVWVLEIPTVAQNTVLVGFWQVMRITSLFP